MIDVEQTIVSKYPSWASKPLLLRKPAVGLLKRICYQVSINAFLHANKVKKGFAFIGAVLDYFNFGYLTTAQERANIPAEGRIIIVANHPIGSLDGLALLKLVSEVRKDIKVLANDMLGIFSALDELLIPVDNMTGAISRQAYKQLRHALAAEEAVLIFPAGEVSRAGPTGIKDGNWRPGFLNFARKMQAPLLPVYLQAKNSFWFYSASMLCKPLSTALLPYEMFRKNSRAMRVHIGRQIPVSELFTDKLSDKTLVKRIKKHVYQLAKKKPSKFHTVTTIAHPENPKVLQAELQLAELLGETRDGNRIYLVAYKEESAVMRELGRLREIAFRRVGEGTGNRCDLDVYDASYSHLVLWDRERLAIAGAYRLAEGKKILADQGLEGFYTASLYGLKPGFATYMEDGVELGRSFVNPDYWGKNSLDYLWQGIGAYLSRYPVRYLIGPVSMSAEYPEALMAELVYVYRSYFSGCQKLAKPHHPYQISLVTQHALAEVYAGLDCEQAMTRLLAHFAEAGVKLPVLFKQYLALFEAGGFQVLAFSVDPDFNYCLDGLCLADLTLMKTSKAKRYLGAESIGT